MPADPRHLYIHVPFCARRCSYCDFAIAVRSVVPVDAFVASVRAECLGRFQSARPWALETIYLGGGTPSRLGTGIESITKILDESFGVDIAAVREYTIEANPEDVSSAHAEAWRRAGVNRVSLGVQSFDPDVLAWMHRTHTPEHVEAAVRNLRSAGITNLSLDLIFAVPDRLERDWRADLERAIALQPDHLSLYGLTVEPATPLGRWTASGREREAPDERWGDQFLEAHERLALAGFEHYEVSNYARPGARAVHNSAYWTGVPYAGVGPSAHGFEQGVRRWNEPAYVAWQRRVSLGEDPMAGSESLDADAAAAERVYLGLRTVDGLRATPAELAIAGAWVDAGWATCTPDGRLVLTPEGWLRLDRLAVELLRAGPVA